MTHKSTLDDSLLEDVGDYEFDEEEYIRGCFTDISPPVTHTSASSSSSKKQRHDSTNAHQSRKPIVYTKQIIPTDDIRRTYAKGFESAWNGYDAQALHDFFHGIAAPDMLTVVAYPRGNPHGPAYREIHGPQATTEYYWTYLMSVPDCLFFVHATKYVIKQNGSISIVCKFTLTGSRVYLVDMGKGAADGHGAQLSNQPVVSTEGLQPVLKKPKTENTSIKLEGTSGSKQLTTNNCTSATTSTAAATLASSESFVQHLNSNSNSHRNSYSKNNSSTSTVTGDSSSSQPGLVDLDDYLEPYNSVSGHLVFRDAFAVRNKHDKYRRLNHSTMGEYIVDCTSQQQMAPHEGQDQQQYKEEEDAEFAAPALLSSAAASGRGGGGKSSTGHKTNEQSRTSNKSSSLSSSNSTSHGSSHAAKKRSPSNNSSNITQYPPGDVQIADVDSTFALSAILPSAVRSHIFGVLRFHVRGGDKKVSKLELLCAFKDTD